MNRLKEVLVHNEIVDRNRVILRLLHNADWNQKRDTIEVARLLGFQSISASFPVISWEQGIKATGYYAELTSMYEQAKERELPTGYQPASLHAKEVPDFDTRNKKGLETLFSKGWILKDNNHDFLPDQMDLQMVIPQSCSDSVYAAACNFAFRFGMETTAFAGNLVVAQEGDGNSLVFREAQACAIRLEHKENGIRIIVEGKGTELERFSAKVCGQFPKLSIFDTWTDRLSKIQDDFLFKNLDGQLGFLQAKIAENCQPCTAFVSPEIEKRRDLVERAFPGITFTSYKEPRKIYQREYDIAWEADVLCEILEREVYPLIHNGDCVRIRAALSEDKRVRERLAQKIEEKLNVYQAQVEEISVLCAYKQGFSWIEEKIIPQLKKVQDVTPVTKIEIAFKPFLQDGVTDWGDKDGAVPSYHNLGGNPQQWYDLPLRYLQELYPIDDIIATELGIAREQIVFMEYQGDRDITYELQAYGKSDGQTQEFIYHGTYKAAYSERTYLNDYPQMGLVHPSTGYLDVSINGATVLSRRIKTDIENIWDIYQSEVLPECRAYIEKKTGGNPTACMQPLFLKLAMEVTASEPNERLGCREDLFSTLDGLHEDLYFAGGDYFKNYGMEKVGELFDAPGLILPIIKKGEGKPFFRVSLYDQQNTQPCLVIKNGKEDHTICIPSTEFEHTQVEVFMESYEQRSDGMAAVICVEGVREEMVAAYASLIRNGVLSIAREFPDINWLILKTAQRRYEISLPVSQSSSINEEAQIQAGTKTIAINEIDLMEDSVIGYEEYMTIIRKLQKVEGIAVYKTAQSFMGRDIYAVEILPKEQQRQESLENTCVSRTKRITKYPSILINARHHANEVSGTNAALMLIREILTNPGYYEIASRLNLVIVPMENVDGAAIHYELQKENPTWKLHVARYNAVGKEFYYEYFNKHTIHTEALGFTNLYRTFLPDIFVDNHGVPTHEWDQQFSGYTSPSFKGFWLPRSLMYGYFWTVSDPEYAANISVNKKMEAIISDALDADEEITALNKEWSQRFDTYAHRWMPKLFPANYYRNMINYWIPYAFTPSHRYSSVRFPWITTVAYTSEVADETAQGDYLKLCAKTHLTHDLATLRMLAESKCVYQNRWNTKDDGIEVEHTRLRPILV